MMPFTDLFPEEDCKRITEWYPTFELVAVKLHFRQLPPQKVKTVFTGIPLPADFNFMNSSPACLSKTGDTPATPLPDCMPGWMKIYSPLNPNRLW